MSSFSGSSPSANSACPKRTHPRTYLGSIAVARSQSRAASLKADFPPREAPSLSLAAAALPRYGTTSGFKRRHSSYTATANAYSFLENAPSPSSFRSSAAFVNASSEEAPGFRSGRAFFGFRLSLQSARRRFETPIGTSSNPTPPTLSQGRSELVPRRDSFEAESEEAPVSKPMFPSQSPFPIFIVREYADPLGTSNDGSCFVPADHGTLTSTPNRSFGL
mmetsp:Transcript_1055/g.4099  ORF Transcript_1055/g.4099 Transcript_1055/m.4099 type:complete len:220 (-) Transcript_1055:116-775(-)